MIFFDLEFYVPPEDRNDPSTQGTLVFNPENPQHKLLGGYFIAFDWKLKKIRQERSYWIWDFTSEPSEKALLTAIYAFFQEEFLFQQGEHSSVLGKRIRDVVTCGFAIGRIDLPTLHIRSQQHHVADPTSLFNVFLKTKIIDLSNTACFLFPKELTFYPKTANEVTLLLFPKTPRKPSGKQVWLDYDTGNVDRITSRCADEVHTMVRIYHALQDKLGDLGINGRK
ncbi:MAG: hypothetical protein ACTSWW_13355 [Promethearchaeota archaeon]